MANKSERRLKARLKKQASKATTMSTPGGKSRYALRAAARRSGTAPKPPARRPWWLRELDLEPWDARADAETRQAYSGQQVGPRWEPRFSYGFGGERVGGAP